MQHAVLRAVALALLIGLSACRGASGVASLPPVQIPSIATAKGKISHVVIIVQENRSFNNLFHRFPGARTATYGYDSHNQKILLQPVSLATDFDLQHDANGFITACNGTGKIAGTDCRMNGFDKERAYCGGPSGPPCPIKYPQYSYVPQSEIGPYFAMAHQYVLADEMFASNFDASSFVSHQYIISGQAESAVDYPSMAWGCPGGPTDKVAYVDHYRHYPKGYKVPCWDPKTLADELDGAGVSWGFYANPLSRGDGIWSAFQAIKHIYGGPDWAKDIHAPSTQFFNDVSGGTLPAVSWVVPAFRNSDHPQSNSTTGPSWVASLVNAIGESKYWNSTAIFIFWDDYGGFFDAQSPAFLDYDGLGVRVPLLIVSPYALKKVSHVHYEHGSILQFVEDQFGLGRMAASDTRATSPEADCFDFSQPPRAFVPIAASYDQNYFKRQPLDGRAPDSD